MRTPVCMLHNALFERLTEPRSDGSHAKVLTRCRSSGPKQSSHELPDYGRPALWHRDGESAMTQVVGVVLAVSNS